MYFDDIWLAERVKMNILVIGLGSMGKRRIRLLKEMFPDFDIYGVDDKMERRNEVSELYGIVCIETIKQINKMVDIDVAFVCTPPLLHSKIITECLSYKWDVFTELNLVSDGYEHNIRLARENGCKLFLSSTFLYREEIRYIRGRIDDNIKWNYIYHIGQYLPDWHPWESYKDFFVGNKRTNGCREIMAIELPWITETFGKVADFNVVSDKMTSLNIEYNDNYLLQITHENGCKGVLVVDVVSPVAIRRLEVYGEQRYLQWNGTPDSLFEYDTELHELKKVTLNEIEEHKEGYSAFIVENAYRNEIKEFFDIILDGKEQSYGFEQDLETLKLIDSLEGKAWMK